MFNSQAPSLYNSLVDGNFKTFIGHTAHSLQIWPDMAFIYLLSGINSAVNGKFVVGAGGRAEPVTIFSLIVGESGERKSAIAKIAKKPHQDWVLQKNKTLKKDLRRVERENKRIKAQIRVLLKKAENASELECKVIDEKIESLENQIQSLKEFRIFFNDVTIPSLMRVLAQYDGRICHFEPEAGLITILCRKNLNVSIFCNAYDGEEIYLDRVNEDPIHIPRPSIPLSITAQPEIVMPFLRNKKLRSNGFLGRFLYLKCPSVAGTRQTVTPPIPEEGFQWWNNKVTSLLDIPDQVNEFGNIVPWRFELDYWANNRFSNYDEDVERALNQGGRLDFFKSYGSKHSGKVLRLAGLIHCIKHDDPRFIPIDDETMCQAINIGEGFIGHARDLYFHASHGKKIEAGQAIFNWVGSFICTDRSNPMSFTAQKAYDNTEGFTRKDIKNAIGFLLQQGLILEDLRQYADEAGKRTVGRKKTPAYILNNIQQPHFLA